MDGGTIKAELAARAARVMPAGGFGNFSTDIILREGRGARVWDWNGREFIDYLIGSGPMLVGHAHPEVTAAIQAQAALGTTFFTNSRPGIELAETIVAAVACADQVRFVSTGTEADLYAMRLARAFTGRDKILKFEGGYHGMSDYALMSLAPSMPGNFPQPVPDSPGIPRSVRDEVLVAPYNDLDAVAALLAEHHQEIGGVIVEPLQRVIPPLPGFLAGLRRLTTQYGIPLIFDEVVTGFRFAYGGAQELYGVTPDICTLGKVIGGGLPLAAIAGRADIMALFDRVLAGEERFLTQIGTLTGNPIAAAAGLATLAILQRPGAYQRLFELGETLMAGLEEALRAAGFAVRILGAPPMFEAVFAQEPITDYRGVLRGDADLARRFNAKLRAHGLLKGDSKYYVSLALTDADVAQTLAIWRAAAQELAAEGSR